MRMTTTPTQFIGASNTVNHFYFYHDVGEVEDYVDFVHTLDHAQEGDIMHLHFATGGGNMEAAIVVLHSMIRTKATLVGYADGGVASAGTILLLACHEYIISEFSHFMFHDGSLQTPVMKFNENLKQAQFLCGLYSRLAHNVYGPFFTYDEIENIIGGSDVYLTAEQMFERIKNAAEPDEEKPADAKARMMLVE